VSTYNPGDRICCHVRGEDFTGTVDRVDSAYIWINLDDPDRGVSFDGVTFGGPDGFAGRAVPVRPEEVVS
jgi:hypothetical protein